MKNRRILGLAFVLPALLVVFGCSSPSGGGSSGNTNIALSNGAASNLESWVGDTVVISIDSNTNGDYFYVIRYSYSSAPTEAQILGQTSSSSNVAMGTGTLSSGKNTIQVSELKYSSEYTAYIVAKNSISTSSLHTISGIKTKAKLRNWTVVDKSNVFGQSPLFSGAIFAEGKFFAVAGKKIFTSTDGIDWTSADLPLTASSYQGATGIAYGNGTIVIPAYDSRGGTQMHDPIAILYSTDGGSTWLGTEAITPYTEKIYASPYLSDM